MILGEQEELVRGQNWDKFYLENIISWWKKKASKRYEKLKMKVGSGTRLNYGQKTTTSKLFVEDMENMEVFIRKFQ